MLAHAKGTCPCQGDWQRITPRLRSLKAEASIRVNMSSQGHDVTIDIPITSVTPVIPDIPVTPVIRVTPITPVFPFTPVTPVMHPISIETL